MLMNTLVAEKPTSEVTGRKRKGRDKEMKLHFSNSRGNRSNSFEFHNIESSDGCV